MANVNVTVLIGRVVADPETRSFDNGGMVAKFRFVTNNRKYNKSTNDWDDDPLWIDVKAFDNEKGRKLATQASKLKKGQQVYVRGHLVLEQWNDTNDGSKRQKIILVADEIQWLEPRGAGDGDNANTSNRSGGGNPNRSSGGNRAGNTSNKKPAPAASDSFDDGPPGDDSDIPF